MERWGKYWVIYYIVFLAVLALLLSRHWGAVNWGDGSYVFLLAAIFGLSAGVALTFTICTELGGRMVLLIPGAINKLKDEGRKEGQAEGRKEGLKEGLKEGRKEGRKEGQEEANQKWVGWNERRMAAERAGLPFDEPPPAGPPGKDGR